MRIVFTKRLYLLILLGVIPMLFSWGVPDIGWAVLFLDAAILSVALIDLYTSRIPPSELTARRGFDRRFAIGDPVEVSIVVSNVSNRSLKLQLKDEYPHEMRLGSDRTAVMQLEPDQTASFSYSVTPPSRGRYDFGHVAVRYLSRLGLVWISTAVADAQTVKVYPNMRRAREIELKALGARSFLAIQRRAVRRGEGREFESMRDYVRGDELRHISWATTARRGRLTTRQYQIERDQTVIIAIDGGRLMTGRIGDETKFDTAIHASLALISACARAGDNCGIAVFGRKVKRSLPPKRGAEHLDAVLELLYDLEPELIEPSYPRAFQFLASQTKKRAFVVILTDLIDKNSSRELLNSLKLLRPRHLPLVVTIGDRDLNAAVSTFPRDEKDVFTQSAAEEIIHQRETALRMVESMGGLALDVTTKTLGPKLLETYLRVKERGLL